METNFIRNIEMRELTKGQIRIADYILKNQKRILGMTALEVGREIGVSDASVIRFSRAVGYEGFSDMKLQIEKELRENSEKMGRHSLFDRFVMQSEKYNKDTGTQSEVLRLLGMNLETSLRQNPETGYERIANRILQADQKIVIGLRGAKGCAVQFSRLLGHLTQRVRVITDEGDDEITQLIELGEDDIVIILNFSRYYHVDEKIRDVLLQQRTPYVLITDSMASPLAKQAEEVLLVETEHCGFFHSMIGTTGVLEYLLILMCWKEPKKFREKIKARDAVLEDYRLK